MINNRRINNVGLSELIHASVGQSVTATSNRVNEENDFLKGLMWGEIVSSINFNFSI